MDTTRFIAWFKFHNISGSAQKLWLIIAFRWSVKLIQNIMSCRFLPEGTPLPLPHRPIYCAAAKCKLIMFHAYPWLWKRYTNVCDVIQTTNDWWAHQYQYQYWLVRSEVCRNTSIWISCQSFGPIKKLGFDLDTSEFYHWSKTNMDWTIDIHGDNHNCQV